MQYADALSYLRALVVSERARQAVEVLADEAERADTAAIALIARAQEAESRARLAREEAETLRAAIRDFLAADEAALYDDEDTLRLVNAVEAARERLATLAGKGE